MSGSADENRYIKDLKKQIVKLKRENAQLKKKNSRIENDFAEYESFLEEREKEKFAKQNPLKEEKSKPECPSCGGREIVEFEVMDKMYYKCSECGSKGKCK